MGTQSSVWRLQEVQELIRLAKWQLLITQNIPLTLQLLDSADEQIKLLNDPRLQFVREAIAADKLSVEHANTIDVDGTLAKIAAIRTALPQLRWTQNFVGTAEQPHPENNTNVPVAKSWRDKLWASIEYLKHFLIIRRHDEKTETHLLDPTNQANVIMILDLTLLKAEIGLLRRDNTLYLQGLDQARETINRYFNVNDAQTKMIVEQIDALEKLTFSTPLPSLDKSLNAIHEVVVKITM